MKEIQESNLNRIMQHMQSKDIATITAFRTDSDVGFSKAHNRERNKKLESKLNAMGYKGFIKIVGYWNERPDDVKSEPIAEESYVVLNTGSNFIDFAYDMIMCCQDIEGNGFDQQAVMVWSHEDQKAYLYDKDGNTLATFNNFNIDNVNQAWSQIKGHKLTFVEESINEDYSDSFNKGGNFMTAMMYQSNKNKFRSEKKT